MTTQRAGEGKTTKQTPTPEGKTASPQRADTQRVDPTGVAGLQQNFGNRAVQRLLAQRSEPDQEQENRQVSSTIQTDIEQKRGHGENLDENTQQQMSEALGYDFSEVEVHTDADAHQLNKSLQARAFTTGQDVFFRQGEYNPHSSEGQELLAHELTHVVQQQEGRVDLGGEGMQVNDPDDAYEKEANQVAEQVAGPQNESTAAPAAAEGMSRNQGAVQRADALEDDILEKPLQRQDIDEEDLMTKPIQRDDVQRAEVQRAEVEEDILQKPVQRADALEDDILEKPLQRQDIDEEDLMAKPIQRTEIEEDILEKPLQRQDIDEEDLMAKPVQRENVQRAEVQRAEVEEDILQKPVQRQTINRKPDCLC